MPSFQAIVERHRRAALALLAAGYCIIGPFSAPALARETALPGTTANAILELPVEFKVQNTNTSGVPCTTDNASYTVRGQLVAPRSALEGGSGRAVTVYLHGINVGAFNWRVPGVPQLDHAAALARLGHAALVVDRLGYDTSDHPNGLEMCLGSAADVTHQLSQKLRSGEYSVTGGRAATFSTVILAGHDAGAMIADIVAYSYKDIDAIVHFNWADQGFTTTTYSGFGALAAVCASGGQAAEQGPPARSDPAGGPAGYAQFLTDEQIREHAHPNTDPSVLDRLERRWNRNPCGEFTSISAAVRINAQRLPEIRVPILYGYTELEFLWTQEALAQQAQYYTNSSDLSTVVIRNAGHFPMFSALASTFQSEVAEWLRSRRLLSSGALTADGCPAANRTIAGGDGSDRLGGTASPDNLAGRSGHDRLSAKGGDDCLAAGSGGDRLWGGDGDDILAAGPGNDRLWAGAGNDRLDGAAGADWLGGGLGSDIVTGGAGDDRINTVDGGRDQVRCGSGRDRVRADRVDVVSGCEDIRAVGQ